MITEILYYSEPISIILLAITYIYHCRWYKYNSNFRDNPTDIDTSHLYGMYCDKYTYDLDNNDIKKVINEILKVGISLYIFSLLSKFIVPFKHYSKYIQLIGLGLIVLIIGFLPFYIIFREYIVGKSSNVIITENSFQQGYWIAAGCTLLLLLKNLLYISL
jgi:hypothetical protein